MKPPHKLLLALLPKVPGVVAIDADLINSDEMLAERLGPLRESLSFVTL